MTFILGIDQGTTGTTCLLIDEEGTIRGRGYREIPQFYPQPGWVEHDPDAIWGSVLDAAKTALGDVAPRQIAAIGITNQRETTILWDRESGKPVHPAIVWQCRRTAGDCEKLRAKGLLPLFRERTGLTLDPYFSGTKLAWLCRNLETPGRKLAFGTIDSFVLNRLTGGKVHATDPTNASRTLLYNIQNQMWDDDLRQALSIPADIVFPEVLPSGGRFGRTEPGAFLGIEAPISAILGDQQAALYGQGCHAAGSAKMTFGTGGFLLLNVGREPVNLPEGLLLTMAAAADGSAAYALEGSVFIAGAAIQWLRDELRIIEDARETDALAREASENLGVYFVPAFVGLGAPYWDAEARGAILGLTRGAGRRHLARAALEAIAYQTRDVLDLMVERAGLDLDELRVDGGAAVNDFLCEFLAGLLATPVNRPRRIETTGLGAAYLAGVAEGLYAPDAIDKLRRTDRIFEPAMEQEERESLYSGWKDAVQMVRQAKS